MTPVFRGEVKTSSVAVSYTHLDVYKRQEYSYEIDASSGAIVKAEQELDD